MFASTKPVLAVEMNSDSRVIVTLPSMDELRQIAGRIVYAIDHPEAEFTAIVQQYNSKHTNSEALSALRRFADAGSGADGLSRGGHPGVAMRAACGKPASGALGGQVPDGDFAPSSLRLAPWPRPREA